MLTAIATLDRLLDAYRGVLGADFTAYRNHTYRVLNLCVLQAPVDRRQIEKIAIAAAFHDMGIWTDGTFDYLRPSVALVRAYLLESGQSDWIPEISDMILEHHKVLPYRGDSGLLVERFRRADWVDVTRGLIKFGLPRTDVHEIFAEWPSAGFHKRLVQLELTHLRSHPWNPLPMMKF